MLDHGWEPDQITNTSIWKGYTIVQNPTKHSAYKRPLNISMCADSMTDSKLEWEALSISYIWHNSARMGKILNKCHNFEIFSTHVWTEWYLWRGQLAVPGQTTLCHSKKNHISWPHLDDQVEAFKVMVFPLNIEFWGNFEAHSHIFPICKIIS